MIPSVSCSGSDLDLESVLMYPDNIEPLLVRRHSVQQQTWVSLKYVTCHVLRVTHLLSSDTL